ncbi:SIP domain-containing protein, partial [Cronobacter sakazakii]|uniref:SIP domain-containing protein n=1 Tax=Cronobacter sakazakii TaxID=28141 RepID=UPI003C2F697E
LLRSSAPKPARLRAASRRLSPLPAAVRRAPRFHRAPASEYRQRGNAAAGYPAPAALPETPGENAAHGERLLEAVKDAATLPVSEQVSAQMTEEDDEEALIWQRAGGAGAFRAWVAAESGAVKRLRHYLTRERQLDPARACFMAYWSRGKSHV